MKNCSKFDRELLCSQTTHRNCFILFGKVLFWGFQSVQTHLCGWNEDWVICDQTWWILLRFIKISKKFNIWKFNDKIVRFWSRITQLTDHPHKWVCTFWNPQANTSSKRTKPFLLVVWEPNNSIPFWEFFPKYAIFV